MDYKRLNDVAEVRSGYPFRTRLDTVAGGRCRVVQMKDVDVAGGLRESDFARIEPPASYESHLLRPGDVLVAARGANNRAVAFAAEPDDTIAAANLIVLRPIPAVLPDYLAWFLNLPATQAELKGRRLGSSVPFLPVSELGDLAVRVPDINLQKRIVGIYKLSLREEELVARVGKLRRTLVDGLLRKALGVEGGNGALSDNSEPKKTI